MKPLSVAVLTTAVLAILPSPARPSLKHVPIGYVKVLRVSQQPYRPVKFRMAVKAPVGLHVSVGYKIFDANGRGSSRSLRTPSCSPTARRV